MKPQLFPMVLIGLFAVAACDALGDSPRVFRADELPNDSRLGPLKDLNGYFPFVPNQSVPKWEDRARDLRRKIQVALGIWPMPTKIPANGVIHGRLEFDDYTIDKVYFESFPGFYVTGNLYRPKNKRGKLPAILSPHGHFTNGRFGDVGLDQIRRQLKSGAERFADSGRNKIQARCVQLARMGCVVFNYDMIGYADSVQISYQVAHRFAKQRPEMNTTEDWGLFSPQAEAHLHSVMGMQTYNSIRALDWLRTLPDVDPERIGVTGSSGGGTQTFMLCALDSRPVVAVPAVMVSTAMQGGCTCENTSLLRIDAGNVDFAALFAPRPLGLISANDWTHEMTGKGFPELKAHYTMLGAADQLHHDAYLQFPHNYNQISRTSMYHWMNQHLKLGLPIPIVERDYHRLSREQLTVWNARHPKPKSTAEIERRVLRWWRNDATQQILRVRPSKQNGMDAYRTLVGGAMESIIGRTLDSVGQTDFEEVEKRDLNGFFQISGKLTHHLTTGSQEQLPVVFLVPDHWDQKDLVFWISPEGKNGLYANDAHVSTAIATLLEKGMAVASADLFMQGEFLAHGDRAQSTRRVNNTREAAAYTFGYNHTVFAKRVHDVLTMVSFARHHDRKPESIAVVGLSQMGPVVTAARAVSGSKINRAAVAINGFRFGKLKDFRTSQFLPGGAKYDDLPGMLAIGAPNPTLVLGESSDSMSVPKAAYAVMNMESALQVSADTDESIHRIIRWLTD